MRWLASDSLADELSDQWREPEINGDTLAFLQYTSGSTASPKGVMVSHANLLHNERVIHAAFEHNEQCSGVSWLPVYHDMGLIGTMLQPLYAGFPFTLMSPVDFLQRPVRWLNAISKYRATVSGGPNFAYDLCVRKVSDEQKESIDLSSWDLAFSGAEPVQASTIEAFSKAFEQCGFRRETFYPCYGLAESTLFVTGDIKSRVPVVLDVEAEALQEHKVIEALSDGSASARKLVSCGRVWLDQTVQIVDSETLVPCPPGAIGEIWVSGPSVTKGYWGLPEESERTFGAYAAGQSREGPFLRTGDLGFLQANELYVTGRCKDLIIFNGRNYYPQDIEWTVERCHPGLRLGCSAAFSLEIDREERLIVVAEVERRYQQKVQAPPSGERRVEDEPTMSDGAASDFSEVMAAIRRAIAAEHELPAYAIGLLKSGSIPKTSSGKIQRHLCKKAFLDNSLDLLLKE
jgi:acyl-CoA synthetase (AMP-forming)/AMP-acid ligase II